MKKSTDSLIQVIVFTIFLGFLGYAYVQSAFTHDIPKFDRHVSLFFMSTALAYVAGMHLGAFVLRKREEQSKTYDEWWNKVPEKDKKKVTEWLHAQELHDTVQRRRAEREAAKEQRPHWKQP